MTSQHRVKHILLLSLSLLLTGQIRIGSLLPTATRRDTGRFANIHRARFHVNSLGPRPDRLLRPSHRRRVNLQLLLRLLQQHQIVLVNDFAFAFRLLDGLLQLVRLQNGLPPRRLFILLSLLLLLLLLLLFPLPHRNPLLHGLRLLLLLSALQRHQHDLFLLPLHLVHR